MDIRTNRFPQSEALSCHRRRIIRPTKKRIQTFPLTSLRFASHCGKFPVLVDMVFNFNKNNTYCKAEQMIGYRAVADADCAESQGMGRNCGMVSLFACGEFSVSIPSILCDQRNILFSDMLQASVSLECGECLSRG